MGVLALLPPYLGPALEPLEIRKEVADHVVPGVVVLAISAVALWVAGRPAGPPPTALFVAGLVITLAGIWMTATHVPLVAQAVRHQPQAPWPATVWHTLPGLAVDALGLWWTAAHW
ncbi:MAG: hypothetical protein LC792_16390 [Actinobacteria bacterium]|nr:hypothetical protein [Actinomycetota bacterium]